MLNAFISAITGRVENQKGINGAALVSTSIRGITQTYEVSNPISGTRKTYYFVGAVALAMSFNNYGSAAADECRIVFNATSDADADAKALSAATRTAIPLGKEVTKSFDTETPCVRMDVYSDVASETGATKLIVEGVSP